MISLALVNNHDSMEASAVIEGKKAVTDSSGGAVKSLAGFKFGLYSDADASIPVKLNGNDAIATSGADGRFRFEGITYSENEIGTHTYYLK